MDLRNYLSNGSVSDMEKLAEYFRVPFKKNSSKESIIDSLLMFNQIDSGNDNQEIKLTEREINTLPELTLREIAHQLDDKDVLSLCRSFKRVSTICKKSDFWIERAEIHLDPELAEEIKASGGNSYQNYRLLALVQLIRQKSKSKSLTLDELKTLTSLDLSGMGLTEIPSGINLLTNLQTLGLSYNELTTIEADAFKGLINLQWLYLNDNKLTTIEADPFKGLTNLQ